MARSLRRANEKKAYERALKIGLQSLHSLNGPRRQEIAQLLGPAIAAIAPNSRGEVRRPGDVNQMLYVHIWLHPDEPQRWEDLDLGLIGVLRSILGENAPILSDAFFDERVMTLDFCTNVDGQLLTARIDVERTARDMDNDPRFGAGADRNRERFGSDDRPRRPFGDRPYGDRPQEDRPYNRPQGDRPYNDRPQGDRPYNRPQGDRPYRDRPQGERPPNRPPDARPPQRKREDDRYPPAPGGDLPE